MTAATKHQLAPPLPPPVDASAELVAAWNMFTEDFSQKQRANPTSR